MKQSPARGTPGNRGVRGARRVRLGIDIGGTFTDLLMLEEKTGRLCGRAKIATTPSDPSVAAMAGLAELREPGVEAVDSSEINFVCHATTVITNALLQRRTARGGLIVTRGFRDVLEIARMVRPRLYDLNVERLPALIPRERIKELSERTLANGEILRPVVEEEIDKAVRELVRDGAQCIAICLINSYANPAHERQVAARIATIAPEMPVTVSSDIVQEYREYQRISSAVVNAVTMPVFSGYIKAFADKLAAEKVTAPFYLMQSSGGMMKADAAAGRPINFVESGPAAGVIAAARLGVLAGYPNVLSFDMGGTTAKVGLIQGGIPLSTNEYSVGGPTHGRSVGATATGYPIRVPVLDLVEVGTGGGSIAYLDVSGGLHVGPLSAGAEPGPMCYGRGGEHPTVTDAHVVTGVIDPDNFLGGRMRLDPDLSFKGIERLAKKLRMDVPQTAQGIIEIADAAMLGALRVMSVERGVDPRALAMIAFGGAGPMRAPALGAALDVSSVVIPLEPGLFSALGLLLTDIRRDEVRSLIHDLATLPIERLASVIAELLARVDGDLAAEGLPKSQRRIARALDLRYRGQSYELSVSLPDGAIRRDTLSKAASAFHELHLRRYSYANLGSDIQLVGVRVSASGSPGGRGGQVAFQQAPKGNGKAARALTGRRRVHLGRDKASMLPIYDRELLQHGDRLAGPAVLEQFDSTILIQPGQRLVVDGYLNLLVTPQRAAARRKVELAPRKSTRSKART